MKIIPSLDSGSSETFVNLKKDPKETAQETDHEIRLRKPATTIPAGDPLTVPMLASMGHQDPMSQQMQQSMPTSITEAKGAWKQRVGSAKITWGKLTDDELLQTEGHMQKLTGLVQERYAITRDEATTQIKTFFAQFKTT